ncbi:MAG: BON domain-containing protein [Acidobacteriota bacterium]
MLKKSTGLFCALALSLSTVAFAQTDAVLTASVKTKLAADDMVKASAVNVTTDGHVVTLAGAVGSQAAKDRALMIARDTTGVTSVVDKLTVRVGTTSKTNAEKAAGGVEKGVDKAAGGVEKGADKSADAVGTAAKKTAEGVDKSKSKIGEAAEKTGDALGTAAKATGKAVGTAARKTGEAIGVGAEKTADATAKAADKTKSATAKAGDKTADATEKAGARTKDATEKAGDKTKEKMSGADDNAGAAMSDAAITAAVKTKLLGDGTTPGLKIDVDTDGGIVTLSGDVSTAAAHLDALRLARGTKGVTRVVDKITVAK